MSTDLDPPADPPPLPPKPRAYPQPNFWWSLLACVGLFVAQTVGFIAVWLVVWLSWCAADGGDFGTLVQADLNAFAQASGPPPAGEPPPPMPQRMAVGVTAGVVGGFVLMFLYAWLLCRLVFGRGWTRTVAFRTPGVWQLLIAWVVFLPGMMYTAEGLDLLVRSLTGWQNANYNWMASALGSCPVWLGLLAIAICPGVVEELFCRGFLGRGLVGRHGWIFGVLLTSLLFGLLHLEPIHVLMTMLMGVCLHFTLATSRSLWVPILLHATNNGSWAVASALNLPQTPPTDPLVVVLRYGGGVALLALGAWALWSCRAKVVPTGENPDGWQPRFPSVAAPPPDSGLTTVDGRPNPLPLILAVAPLGGLVLSWFVR
jgi:membrane protease YdiL (CAAX protease family)